MQKGAKKRVLIFSTNYFPNVGGAEVAIKEITDRLPGFEFELICARLDSKLPSTEKVGNVLVHRLGFGNPFDKLLAPFLGALKIFAIKPDFCWAVMVTYASGAPYIYNLVKFWNKIPIVLTLQEGDSETHLTKRHFGLLDLAWKFSIPRSAKITALSNYLADRALKYGARIRPEIVPNGVAEDYFVEHKSKANIKTIVTTSRLVDKNAVDVLIRAMTHLPDHTLLIAGDGEERANLESLVKSLELDNRVKFLGTVLRPDLPKFLANADIFCRPSRSEGLGVSFLEAMAVGLPVIATNVGGIPDFLTEGETGLFCKVDDPKSIAEKVDLLANDAKLCQKIITNAKELMSDKYKWPGIASKMSEVFEASKNMRPVVLMAASIYPPDPGGPALHARNYFEEFPKLGLDCRLVSFRDYRKYPKGLSHFFYTLALAKSAIGADVIYAHDALSVGFPAALVSKIFGLPLIVRTGGDILWERSLESGGVAVSLSQYYKNSLYFGQLKYVFIKATLDRASKVIVPAEILREVYINYYNQVPDKITLISNPV